MTPKLKVGSGRTCEYRDSVELHKVRGRNMYCGPAVISALTGLTTGQAAKKILTVRRENNNNKKWLVKRDTSRVTCVWAPEIQDTMFELGFLMMSITIHDDLINVPVISVANLIRQESRNDEDLKKSADYMKATFGIIYNTTAIVISADEHLVSIRGDMIVDNHCKTPMLVSEYYRRFRKPWPLVRDAWHVWGRSVPRPIESRGE